MVYEVNKPLDLLSFGEQMDAVFQGRGMQVGREMMSEGDESWWRYSIQPQGTQLSPLVLDLSPGPSVGEFGHSIAVRSQRSQKHALMGAEVFYGATQGGGEPSAQIYDPFENIGRYVQSAASAARTSPTFERTSMHEEFWQNMTLGSAQYGLAGSIPRAGGASDTGTLVGDVASQVGVGFGSEIRDINTARQHIRQNIEVPPGGGETARKWRSLQGFGFFSETSDQTGVTVSRLKRAGIPTSEGGILGIGESEADMIKRRSSTMGFAGTRQQQTGVV